MEIKMTGGKEHYCTVLYKLHLNKVDNQLTVQ